MKPYSKTIAHGYIRNLISIRTLIFYKHMNFLAEAFAKHILCLFFSTKAFMCYVLNFKKKKPSCAYSAKWITLNFLAKAFVLAKLCLWCAYFFRQKPSCAMCLIFSKKSLHVLNWPCAYNKKWVYIAFLPFKNFFIIIINSKSAC